MSRGPWLATRNRLEELEFMMELHQPISEVLPRIGVPSVDALITWLQRQQRPDVITRLMRLEPWIRSEMHHARQQREAHA